MQPKGALRLNAGSHREAGVSCAVMGYCAASSGNYLPTFRDNETSLSNYDYSLRNNPEERSSKRRQIFPNLYVELLTKISVTYVYT